jgi:hypothetical protein
LVASLDPLTPIPRLTPILCLTLVFEPLESRRLVPKASNIQSALSRKQFDVLVGHVEIPGIADQGDPGRRRL